MVRLDYRYGISIDEILMDVAMGKEFEQLVLRHAPDLTTKQIRRAALNFRKRGQQMNREKINRIDLAALDRHWTESTTADRLDSNTHPGEPGLVEVKEPHRYLYVTRSKRLNEILFRIRNGSAFEPMNDGFWKPNLSQIQVRYFVGTKTKLPNEEEIEIPEWEWRLIREKRPIFNLLPREQSD